MGRVHSIQPGLAAPPAEEAAALERLLVEGATLGDSLEWLPALPPGSVDLFFTSPPYADARSYSRIHPDRYVEWFLPFGARCCAPPRRAAGLCSTSRTGG